MIKVRYKLRAVLWTDHKENRLCDYHGFSLREHDRALKDQIARMLREMPKKRDRRKGRIDHIFALPGVTCAWF